MAVSTPRATRASKGVTAAGGGAGRHSARAAEKEGRGWRVREQLQKQSEDGAARRRCADVARSPQLQQALQHLRSPPGAAEWRGMPASAQTHRRETEREREQTERMAFRRAALREQLRLTFSDGCATEGPLRGAAARLTNLSRPPAQLTRDGIPPAPAAAVRVWTPPGMDKQTITGWMLPQSFKEERERPLHRLHVCAHQTSVGRSPSAEGGQTRPRSSMRRAAMGDQRAAFTNLVDESPALAEPWGRPPSVPLREE